MDKFLAHRSGTAPSSPIGLRGGNTRGRDATTSAPPSAKRLSTHTTVGESSAQTIAKRARSGASGTSRLGLYLNESTVSKDCTTKEKSGDASLARRSSVDPEGVPSVGSALRDKTSPFFNERMHQEQRLHNSGEQQHQPRGNRNDGRALSAIALARAALKHKSTPNRWGASSTTLQPSGVRVRTRFSAGHSNNSRGSNRTDRYEVARSPSSLAERTQSLSSDRGQRSRIFGDIVIGSSSTKKSMNTQEGSGQGEEAGANTVASVGQTVEARTAAATVPANSSRTNGTKIRGHAENATTGDIQARRTVNPTSSSMLTSSGRKPRVDSPPECPHPSSTPSTTNSRTASAIESTGAPPAVPPVTAAVVTSPSVPVAPSPAPQPPSRMTSYFPRANSGSVVPGRGPRSPGFGTNKGKGPRPYLSCHDARQRRSDDEETGAGGGAMDSNIGIENVEQSRSSRTTSTETLRLGRQSAPSAAVWDVRTVHSHASASVEDTTAWTTGCEGSQQPGDSSTTDRSHTGSSVSYVTNESATTTRHSSSLAAAAAEMRARAAAISSVADESNRTPSSTPGRFEFEPSRMTGALEGAAATTRQAGEVAAPGVVEAETAQDSAQSGAAFATEVVEGEKESERLNRHFKRVQIAQVPGRRLGSLVASCLTQWRRTGSRRGVGGGGGGGFNEDAGKEAFRRHVLSSFFGAGLTRLKLRMGRVIGSNTGAGVVRGQPVPAGRDGAAGGRSRISGLVGVTCLEFDAVGALLAAGGPDSVSVYDFDEFLPKINKVQSSNSGGTPEYLQPGFCLVTGRAVSCVRWNPANENQLAVCFLHHDEIEVYDLELVVPNRDAVPVAILVSDYTARRNPRAGDIRRVPGGGGPGASGGGSRGVSHMCISGVGYDTMEFVMREGQGDQNRRVACLVAGGKGGVFQAWRLDRAGEISSYVQIIPGRGSNAGGTFTGWLSPRADIKAVCCISPDVAVVGTDDGTIATMSLKPPTIKAFGSRKSAVRLRQWSLNSPGTWGGMRERASQGLTRIRWMKPSPGHAHGVIVCGLQSGRVVVFDTRAGCALGITAPDVVTPSDLFCQPGADGAWGDGLLSCTAADHEGQRDLVLLATSARAGLDTMQRGGRFSRLRPGPGWALGETGGGGYRVVASSGYDVCLPMQVKRATPGQSAIVLEADARSYLCPRAEVGLLRTRMVTSSVMIAGEEHSVEAMGTDGMTLVLDRRYRGPLVRENQGECEAEEAGGCNPAAVTPAAGLPLAILRPTCDGSSSHGRNGGMETGGESQDGRQDTPTASSDSNRLADSSREGTRWDRSWRPAGKVKVFAKLKAVFGDWQTAKPTSLSSRKAAGRLRLSPWEKGALVAVGGAGSDDEIMESDSDSSTTGVDPPITRPTETWASLQVVARAPLLELSPTALTCHPSMNFVTVGLEDGTVVAILPGRRTKLGTRTKPKSKKRRS